MDVPSWWARVRPEYIWPYRSLEPGTWYPVRADAGDPRHQRWLWLATEPYASYVWAEHVELRHELGDTPALALAVADRDPPRRYAPIREARLRPRFQPLYPHLTAGVWYYARDLVLSLLESPAADPADRRRRRLEPAHFDFRDVEP